MGREPLFSGGARPHLFTLSPRCFLFRSPERVAAVVVFGPVFSFCFLSGGYAPPIGIAPRFWIVYALAMRSVAYYALGCVSSCAHLTVRRCRAGRVVVCGVAVRVGVRSVWRSARLRARACWRYTCVLLRGGYDARAECGASRARPGSPPGVIE